jgi:hydrogenase expression/formation protein HypD
MEFCGGHTVSILKNGIRQLLPKNVEMVSGPGCPVCVTANADLDKSIALANLPNTIITTFGDMIRVPGSYSSLQQVKSEGADVRIVYSIQDALSIAADNPQKSIIFIGIGFETTAPTVAAGIIEAESRHIRNFYVQSILKTCPPVVKALLDIGEIKIDGFICPGHVSAIIGSHPYEFISRDYGIACAISGFEPLDILLAISMLIDQIEGSKPTVDITYRRGVKPEGNIRALDLMYNVFEISDANWRGIGILPGSGLQLARKYERFNAERTFSFKVIPTIEHKECLCGHILRGVKTPIDCKLFLKTCTPEHPVGPCMVSNEGTCSAYYHYGVETYNG